MHAWYPFTALGPVNTHSLLVASIVTHLLDGTGAAPTDQRGLLYLQLAVGLGLAKGVMQMVLAKAGVGGLVKYVSRSVVAGFTAGAGVLIAVGQLPACLGVDITEVPHLLPGAFGVLERVGWRLGLVDLRAVLVGLVALAATLGIQHRSKHVPGPLLGVIAAALLAWICGWSGESLPMIAALPRAWPMPSVPLLRLDQLNVFETTHGIFASAQRAWRRAQDLVRGSEAPSEGSQTRRIPTAENG